MFNDITRGGQTLLHRIRMFRQVVKSSLITSCTLGLLIFALFVFQKIPSKEWQHFISFVEAKVYLSMPLIDDVNAITQDYTLANGKVVKIKSKAIVRNQAVLNSVSHIFRILKLGFILFLLTFSSIMSLMFIGWFWWGKNQTKTTHERGAKLNDNKKLIKLLKRKKLASDLTFANVPIIKNSETSHILLAGTTGAGKTNAINQLLKQIRKKGQKAIIVDVVGNYVENFYREDKDILLNFMDERHSPWNFWADIKEEPHYNETASSIIQGNQHSYDKFWVESAQVVFSEILKKLRFENKANNKELIKYLFESKVSDLEDFMKDTAASRLTTSEAEKMTYGILAQFGASLHGVKYLGDTDKPFSIRDWVADEDNDSCLFLSAHPTHRSLLVPFLSFWLDTAVSGLMGLPTDNDRRLWFIIDELPALQKLSCLPTILKEGRKFGGCVVAGFQSISDLYNKYGRDEAKVLLDCFNTQLLFRCKDPETSRYISNILGSAEILESRESHSYGAHEMRDGTSLNKNRIQKQLVMPSEIALLEDLTAFLKLPGPYPVTKLKFQYKNILNISESFKLKSKGLVKIDENVTAKLSNKIEQNASIVSCFFEDEYLNICLDNEETKKISLKTFSPLLYADKEKLKQFYICSAGKSVNWPKIGLTIHIDNL